MHNTSILLIFNSVLILFFSVSCVQNDMIKNNHDTEKHKIQKEQDDNKTDNGLAFINDYVKYSNEPNSSYDIVNWVKLNSSVSERFVSNLEKILEEAYKEDPELGLGFDPLFNAQDYPEKGFEIASFDEESNYLIVRGIDQPDFKVTMKIKKENGNWLVDGCGIVNIPQEKR